MKIQKKKHSCGGEAFQRLLQETQSIIVTAYPNDPDNLSTFTVNCPYVLGVAGYDMYASIPNYKGHAPIAQSHDFYIDTYTKSKKGTRISETPRSVSIPFGRPLNHYKGADSKIAFNPRVWPFVYYANNSFSTPSVTGLVAEIMAYWPGGPGALTIQNIYDLLNYGSWRRAYPHDGNGLPFPGLNHTDAPKHSDPIVNYPCVMASALLANLNSKKRPEENPLNMSHIYEKLGPAKAFSIFGGLKCDPPYQNLDP